MANLLGKLYNAVLVVFIHCYGTKYRSVDTLKFIFNPWWSMLCSWHGTFITLKYFVGLWLDWLKYRYFLSWILCSILGCSMKDPLLKKILACVASFKNVAWQKPQKPSQNWIRGKNTDSFNHCGDFFEGHLGQPHMKGCFLPSVLIMVLNPANGEDGSTLWLLRT